MRGRRARGASGAGMRRRVVLRPLVLCGLALLVGVVPLGPASAATMTSGLWTLNESPGAATAADRGPGGMAGSVGADVRTGVVHSGVTGYRFPDVAPNALPVHPDHLVTVPPDPSLDPGDG